MSTPTHIQLLAELNGSIIPALALSGDFVVTGNVNEPGEYQIRAFTGRGLSTYPVADVTVGNPHIYVKYVSGATSRKLESILSGFSDVVF